MQNQLDHAPQAHRSVFFLLLQGGKKEHLRNLYSSVNCNFMYMYVYDWCKD